MTQIIWDPKARQLRYLKNLISIDAKKLRIGDYRLFADYYQKEDKLIIRSIRHRKNAYKK